MLVSYVSLSFEKDNFIWMGPSADAQEVSVVDVTSMSTVTPGVVLGVTLVGLVCLSVL